ncbi:unnamed protein product, partial [Effrenium voratum]
GRVDCTRVIVLEKQNPKHPHDLWVADDSASILLSGNGVPEVDEGDIFLLQNCEAFLQEQRLFLRLGRGRLVRDGFLALLFKEAPNLSTSVWTPQEPQGQGQSQGNRCFLCSAEDHSVLDCEFLPCGVVIKSPQMEELDRQQRRARLEEALEKENFGPPEAVRWYKKETSGSGLLYVRLASPELAHELLQQEVLDIGGEPANVYPITK